MAIDRQIPHESWRDENEADAAGSKPLTRQQAQDLRARQPSLSPWCVVGAQVALGGVLALLAVLVTERQELMWSVLYGAATAVVPAALMARGMTSKLSSVSPSASVVSVMLWQFVKIGVSVAMLLLAPKLVQDLSWPALLVGLVLCLKVYVLALLWRPAVKNK